ncbi:MAG: hypothetical protein P4L45_13660, partial [Ignavibacteriaceae bacterium]|nr:hypothetical protein [Ignavibacteriaceae bacterium]
MIPEWADEKVYELFKQFIQKCVLTDDSFLTDEKEAVTLTAIDDCIERFIVKGIEGKGTFEDKIIKQFADAYYNTKLTFAHVNWLWCMSPSDFGINYKKTIAAWILGDSKRGIIRDDIYPSGGFGDAGPALKFRKHKEISFLLLIMKQLKQNVHKGLISNLQQAIEMVEKICIECRFNFENETSDIIDENIWKLRPEGKLAMYNILLHLCMP